MSILDNIRNLFFASPKKTEQRGLGLNTLFPNANYFNTDKAFTLTAVWGAVRLLSESVSSLPCSVYTKAANGDKVEADDNRIYNLIKYRPNNYQNKITRLEKENKELENDFQKAFDMLPKSKQKKFNKN